MQNDSLFPSSLYGALGAALIILFSVMESLTSEALEARMGLPDLVGAVLAGATVVPRVHKVWGAIDCGVVVNPVIVRAQMESGIVYGITTALYGENNIGNGRVVQSNFDGYQMLRMDEAPEVAVLLTPSGDDPSGAGESGTPPIVPAVTNAIFALTGERIRKLPIRLS